MICISIGELYLNDCLRAVRLCEKIAKTFLKNGGVEVIVEIRLDLCKLSEENVRTLFSSTKLPLIATCRRKTAKLLITALEAGASYVDIDFHSSPERLREITDYARKKKAKLIFSHHDYNGTPSIKELRKSYDMAVDAGADIIKIATFAKSVEDAERVLSLYDDVKKIPKTNQRPLVAIAMGEIGTYTRLETLNREAPFSYCALNDQNKTAEGQLTYREMFELYPKTLIKNEVEIPSSKSVAQRAILAAGLAKGESVFNNYSRCRDNDVAVGVAKQVGCKVSINGDILAIRGDGFPFPNLSEILKNPLLTTIKSNDTLSLFVGESGLLSRLCIPLAAQMGKKVTITGEGTLMRREMYGCKEALELFGANCLLTAEETLPAVVDGPLIGKKVTISGKKGSQLISGLLMSLPLCKKNSTLIIENATSIPYIYLTISVLEKFGIKIDYRKEGGNLIFDIEGKQEYIPTELTIEGDWSSAANFIVAAAIFGNISIKGLNFDSYQADMAILDVIEKCGAKVTKEKGVLTVSRFSLTPFNFDATHSPDIFPILTVLAAFCEGTSSISGIDRLSHKESNRTEAICQEFGKMGAKIRLEGNSMFIEGKSLSRRMLEKDLLKGGTYQSFSDHRIVMALRVASLGCSGRVSIDGNKCVDKSFPKFEELFSSVTEH